MSTAPATAAAATGLFVVTNIDDMILLVVLSMSRSANGRPKRWQIWAGQYTGMAILVLISLAAARGSTVLPTRWTWVLGLIPITVGTYKLIAAIRASDADDPAPATVANGLTGVIGLTVANGGDNVATYTPVFRLLGAADIAVAVAVFAVGVALWCLLSGWLVSHRWITHLIQTWGRWVVPTVIILIGFYVFYKAGVLGV